MEKIRVEAFKEGSMHVKVVAPGMAEEPLTMIVPETIAEARELLADKEIAPSWSRNEEGELEYRWRTEGKAEFHASVRPGEDFIDVGITLTNVGRGTYRDVFSFTCVNPGVRPGDAPSFREPLLKGTFIRVDGEWRDLRDLPAHDGPRPQLQFIMSREAGLESLPACHESFRNHLKVVADCGLIASVGGNGYVIAVACEHPLFLFQNREFWCLHACPNLGRVSPGETKSCLQRVYVIRGGLEEVYERAASELELEPKDPGR